MVLTISPWIPRGRVCEFSLGKVKVQARASAVCRCTQHLLFELKMKTDYENRLKASLQRAFGALMSNFLSNLTGSNLGWFTLFTASTRAAQGHCVTGGILLPFSNFEHEYVSAWISSACFDSGRPLRIIKVHAKLRWTCTQSFMVMMFSPVYWWVTQQWLRKAAQGSLSSEDNRGGEK